MADAAALPPPAQTDACLPDTTPDASTEGPLVWESSDAPTPGYYPLPKRFSDEGEPGADAAGMRGDESGPEQWDPPFQPLLAVGLPPPAQVLLPDPGVWLPGLQAAAAAPAAPPLLRGDEARQAELQKGAEILAFSRRLGLLDLPLPDAPAEDPPSFGPPFPPEERHSSGGALGDGVDGEQSQSEGSAARKDAETEGFDTVGQTAEEAGPAASVEMPGTELSRASYQDHFEAAELPLHDLRDEGSPRETAPLSFREAAFAGSPERAAAAYGGGASAEAVLASPPGAVVPELDAAALLGRGELAAEERVPLWNRRTQRKLTGRCGPMRKNLQDYLDKHPDCEIYHHQQPAGPSPAQVAAARLRSAKQGGRAGGQKRGAAAAPTPAVQVKRRATMGEGYYRALQEGRRAGASKFGQRARDRRREGTPAGLQSQEVASRPGSSSLLLPSGARVPWRWDLAWAAYGSPPASGEFVNGRTDRGAGEDAARDEQAEQGGGMESVHVSPPGGGGKRKKIPAEQSAALQALAEAAGWSSVNIETRAATVRLCTQYGMTLGQVKKWFSNHRPKDLASPTSPRTPLDAHWSFPERSLPPSPAWPSHSRGASPPPASPAAASRSPSPVLHALLPAQPPAPHGPPPSEPSPDSSSLGGTRPQVGASPQALAAVPSSGSLQGAPSFASSGLPPSPGLRGSLRGPLPLDFLSRDTAHELLGAHLSLGPPADEALLAAGPALFPHGLHQDGRGPSELAAGSSAPLFRGRAAEAVMPLFGRAADLAGLEDGAPTVGEYARQMGWKIRDKWSHQEEAKRRSYDGWPGESSARPGPLDEEEEGLKGGSETERQEGGAQKHDGSFEADAGGLAGFDLESNDASELDALMECEEGPLARKYDETYHGRALRSVEDRGVRSATPGAVARGFQQAFTDRTVQMASLERSRRTPSGQLAGWGSMREDARAGEDTWQSGGRNEEREQGPLAVRNAYRMQLRRSARAGMVRSPSPYSLRMSTLQRSRQAAALEQQTGARSWARMEGDKKPQQSHGAIGGPDLPAMLRSTGFRGSGPRSRVQAVLFEKALTLSDTSHLGRIVLPKGCAEKYLPPMDEKEGRPIVIEDNYGARWCFRYRFWPNNKSKMYVLEHSGDFLRAHRLHVGDVVQFCRSELGHLIVQGKREAARQAAGLPQAGASSRAAPLRPPRELRPHTNKRSPAAARQRRRAVRPPLAFDSDVASFAEIRARARDISMTSEELLRSSREIREEMRASLVRDESGGAFTAPPYGCVDEEEEEEEEPPDGGGAQQQEQGVDEGEEALLAAAGVPAVYDPRASFSPPQAPPVPQLPAEGPPPFRLPSLYPAALYSELARGSPPAGGYPPLPRPTPQYLAPPWTGALPPGLFPWAGRFAGTPPFGVDAGGLLSRVPGLMLGGAFNADRFPPDASEGGYPERTDQGLGTAREAQNEFWHQADGAEANLEPDHGRMLRAVSEERTAEEHDEQLTSPEGAQGDDEAVLGRSLVRAGGNEAQGPDAGEGGAAVGRLQPMPRVAGLYAVEQSLALLSGRGGREVEGGAEEDEGGKSYPDDGLLGSGANIGQVQG